MPTVLVTGANRGIGLELVRQYAADGWRVIAACRDPSAAKELRVLAGTDGSRSALVALDVTKMESVRHAGEELADEAIDLLINCAGTAGTSGQTVGRVDYENWARVLDINTMGVLRVTETFLDQIARSDRKLVVTITSAMGSLADNNSGGSIAYRTSKAAVNMVMRSAAIDLAPRGITCCLVHPGWVQTDMGGPNAKISVDESVTAMRKLFAGLGPKQSGSFFNYDGRPYEW